MQNFLAAALISATLLSPAAFAADGPAPKGTPAYIEGASVRTAAEVVSIDLPKRKVGLKLDDGRIAELVVGKGVRNLPQVKVGDFVTARYDRELVVKLKKGSGLRVTEEKSESERNAPGEKPGAAVASEVHFIADVIEVNNKTKKVRVKGASGNIYELRIKDSAIRKQIQVGDQVEGVYLQVLAMEVVPPTGK